VWKYKGVPPFWKGHKKAALRKRVNGKEFGFPGEHTFPFKKGRLASGCSQSFVAPFTTGYNHRGGGLGDIFKSDGAQVVWATDHVEQLSRATSGGRQPYKEGGHTVKKYISGE